MEKETHHSKQTQTDSASRVCSKWPSLLNQQKNQQLWLSCPVDKPIRRRHSLLGPLRDASRGLLPNGVSPLFPANATSGLADLMGVLGGVYRLEGCRVHEQLHRPRGPGRFFVFVSSRIPGNPHGPWRNAGGPGDKKGSDTKPGTSHGVDLAMADKHAFSVQDLHRQMRHGGLPPGGEPHHALQW